MPDLTVLQPVDRQRAIDTLLLAFASDPVVRWVLQDASVYASVWPRFIEAFGGKAFENGTADALDGASAVALWLPPGVGSDDDLMAELIDEGAAESARPDLEGFFGLMAATHPTFDHWYLPLTGVDPWAQGRGLGTALLSLALVRCDQDGRPAYLEATSPRNRALYARHGFEEIGLIQSGGSPPMWPMLRAAR